MEVVKQDILVRSLHLRYPAAKDRFESVAKTEAGTFSWILHDSDRLLAMEEDLAMSLPKWLASGDGVFHIAGKPGSGKSTLMKLLVSHGETKNLLSTWAGEKELIFASFFIWRLGGDGHKTWKGLVGSLLYDVVQQKPTVIKTLFPGYWASDTTWADLKMNPNPVVQLSEDDISSAFEKLTNTLEARESYSICFFIDGLDEFDEATTSYWDLAQRIKTMSESSSSSIKICVSSREYLSIERVFPSRQRIRLHRLTKEDITQLCTQRLNGNPFFRALRAREEYKTQDLIKRITVEAEGVFLWLVLLLKQLEDELAVRGNAVSTTHLLEIVNSAPRELEDFFGRILDTIPSHHRDNAMMLLSMALTMLGLPIEGTTSSHPGLHPDFGWEVQCLSRRGITSLFNPCQTPEPLISNPPVVSQREKETDVLISTWCRGLLAMDGQLARFSHRSIPELLQRILRRRKEPNLTTARVAETILEIVLAELNPGKPRFTLYDGERTSFVVWLLSTSACSTTRAFSTLHAIEVAAERSTIHPSISDYKWVRLYCMGFLEGSELSHCDASVLNAAARFGLSDYVLWEIEHHLRFPEDKNRIEVILAFAVYGVVNGESNVLHFAQVLQSCVQKWREASVEGRTTFPWTLTWLDFVYSYVFCGMATTASKHTVWSILERWLKLGLTCPFTLQPSTDSLEGRAYYFTSIPPELQLLKGVHGTKRTTRTRQLSEDAILTEMHWDDLSVSSRRTGRSLWRLHCAPPHRGQLSLRDLVELYRPSNSHRLLQLIDGNSATHDIQATEKPVELLSPKAQPASASSSPRPLQDSSSDAAQTSTYTWPCPDPVNLRGQVF